MDPVFVLTLGSILVYIYSMKFKSFLMWYFGTMFVFSEQKTTLKKARRSCMRTSFKIIISMVLLVLAYVPIAHSATIKASSCSASDVQAAIDSASQGDTVIVPAGSCDWRTKVTMNKGITLQGAGIGKTIITDDVAGTYMLSVSATTMFRITGFTFNGGTVNKNWKGIIGLFGICHQFRIDHCKFFDWKRGGKGIIIGGDHWGVIDHCTFDTNGNFAQAMEIQNSNYLGVGSYGDNAWAQPDDFGTEKFLFIEDCSFKGAFANTVDAYNGARVVFRYNQVQDDLVGNHGTETSGRWRSARAFEIYNNVFNARRSASWPEAVYIRGGTAVIHDNTYTGYNSHSVILATYRLFTSCSPWGACDGLSDYDDNDATVYDSGTATGNGTLTMTDATKNWTVDQWKGYSVINTERSTRCKSSIITSNTSDTLKFSGTGGGNCGCSDLVFNIGDNYEIRKAKSCIDQPGRGQGLMMTGKTPVLESTGQPGWPQNQLDPVYEWNDSSPDGSTKISIGHGANLHEGIDFFNNTKKPGYTPYIYPHPLVTGEEELQAPSNLHIAQ